MEKILTKEVAMSLTGEHIIIPEGYTVIEKHAFANHDMASVEITESIRIIDHGAFMCCDNLTSVDIPDGVEKIGCNAFSSCAKLESVTIPGSVTVIDDGAFQFNENLRSVILSQGLVAIGGGAFSRTALKSITIPASVKYMYPIEGNELRSIESGYAVICDELFAGCYELTGINVDPGNERFTSVDGVLFTKDMSILLDYPAGKPDNTYAIPDGIKIVNYESFGGCRNLESIIIPDSVTEIDDGAFIFCEKLESITIPKSVKRIEPSAFGYCKKLKDIFVDDENTAFASMNGVLVSKDETVLVRYPEGREDKSYIVPESVKSIGYGAFTYKEKDREDKSTIEVTVYDSVETVEGWAFYNPEHFIIRCRENSPAHKYAIDEKIAFELI